MENEGNSDQKKTTCLNIGFYLNKIIFYFKKPKISKYRKKVKNLVEKLELKFQGTEIGEDLAIKGYKDIGKKLKEIPQLYPDKYKHRLIPKYENIINILNETLNYTEIDLDLPLIYEDISQMYNHIKELYLLINKPNDVARNAQESNLYKTLSEFAQKEDFSKAELDNICESTRMEYRQENNKRNFRKKQNTFKVKIFLLKLQNEKKTYEDNYNKVYKENVELQTKLSSFYKNNTQSQYNNKTEILKPELNTILIEFIASIKKLSQTYENLSKINDKISKNYFSQKDKDKGIKIVQYTKEVEKFNNKTINLNNAIENLKENSNKLKKAKINYKEIKEISNNMFEIITKAFKNNFQKKEMSERIENCVKKYEKISNV